MTDNEIIKALEAESTPSELNCVHGEYIEACGIYCAKKHENAKYCHDCKEHSMAYCGRRAKATLDLINRQKAEIERLKSMNQSKLDIIHDIRADLETAKTEAVKEFAAKLDIENSTTAISCNTFDRVVRVKDIDTLVKKFTEGEKV